VISTGDFNSTLSPEDMARWNPSAALKRQFLTFYLDVLSGTIASMTFTFLTLPKYSLGQIAT